MCGKTTVEGNQDTVKYQENVSAMRLVSQRGISAGNPTGPLLWSSG